MQRVPRYAIGVDLHQQVLRFCVADRQGRTVHEQTVRIVHLPGGEQVFAHFEPWRGQCRLTVEAVGMNRWFVDGLRARGYPVVVADPTKLNLKLLGKKTDKRDAQELARRLWLGDIDRGASTYYPSEQEYGDRQLERTRHDLIRMRQGVTNRLRALLRAYNLAAPAVVLYSGRGLRGLRQLDLGNAQRTLCLRQLTVVLTEVQAAITALQQDIEVRVRRDRQAQTLVRHLPGVGPVSALTIVSELGDVHRFRDARAVVSYVGLAPRVFDSGDKAHHGRLTKRGNRELRFVLCQWAVRLLARDARVRQWAATRHRTKHCNKIRMVLARKLLVGVWRLLAYGEVFDLELCLAH